MMLVRFLIPHCKIVDMLILNSRFNGCFTHRFEVISDGLILANKVIFCCEVLPVVLLDASEQCCHILSLLFNSAPYLVPPL